eukprot:9041217-Ditylum_brightwellii.AAC.1
MCKLKNSIDDVDDENVEKGASTEKPEEGSESQCELKVLIFGDLSNKKTISCAAIKRKKEEEKKKERENEVVKDKGAIGQQRLLLDNQCSIATIVQKQKELDMLTEDSYGMFILQEQKN